MKTTTYCFFIFSTDGKSKLPAIKKLLQSLAPESTIVTTATGIQTALVLSNWTESDSESDNMSNNSGDDEEESTAEENATANGSDDDSSTSSISESKKRKLK
jgi:hypothetical protein